MKARLLAAGIAALALALPGTALAASDTDTVSGTVGSELSISTSGNVSLSAFSPSTDGAGSSTVSISSTQSSWTLSIKDSGLTTPGQLDKVDCDTREALSGSLASALAWAVPSGNSGSLSGTDATVRTGASVEDVTVNFTQAIGATEDLVQDDCYELAAVWTVA